MRARQFFYFSAGVLLLVVSYSIGASNAHGDFDLGAGPIIGLSHEGAVLRSDGTVWQLLGGTAPSWIPHGCGGCPWNCQPGDQITLPPGLPASDIAFWDQRYLVTRSGVGWYQASCNEWVSAGQIPLPTVALQSRTWSGLKDSYRK